jgi:hypothetical protein
MLWPILLLSLKAETAARHHIVATDVPDKDPDHEPCEIKGDVIVEANSCKQVDGWDNGRCMMWAVCAYQATDDPPSAWPIKLRVG